VWTPEERFELVAKVLVGNSIKSVSLAAHINPGQLCQWVNRYRERGMEGLQCRKGRKPKGIAMKPKKKKPSQSEQEELKLLRERNEYLEIENEYLKKLDALVSKREAARPKAKKRK
jgi:transposase